MQYLNSISMKVVYVITNLISTPVDGAPALIKRHNGVLKLLKKGNPRLMAVHCIIYRENLVAASNCGELDQMLKKVINVGNWIKYLPSNERMFKQLLVDMDKDHIRLLLHICVRWLCK